MKLEIIILAAGLGTRMRSPLPKVLHPVAGYPMLQHLLMELDGLNASVCTEVFFNIVVGYKKETVRNAVEQWRKDCGFKNRFFYSVQDQQLGTADALKCALANAAITRDSNTRIAVLNGDLPLLSLPTFVSFLEAHCKARSVASLISATLEDPAQYGRIIRLKNQLREVIEFKDASAKQRQIREINAGVYLFENGFLEKALPRVQNSNKQNEFYLTDLFKVASQIKKKSLAHCIPNTQDILGVNQFSELAHAQKIVYRRKAEQLMMAGVRIEDPDSVCIGREVECESEVKIGPHAQVHGKTLLKRGAQVGTMCLLKNMTVGEDTEIKNFCVLQESEVGARCVIGPMAHLRPQTILGDEVKIGNFVEVKASRISSRTSASHLSYIGDAEVGSHVNIGCGFVTCNYDGLERNGSRKHRTVIGDGVFIGSDAQVVAPIEIASGTFIASGSTITESITEVDSLVLARSRQVVKPGYARKYRGQRGKK